MGSLAGARVVPEPVPVPEPETVRVDAIAEV
jgi:hypothetical protein